MAPLMANRKLHLPLLCLGSALGAAAYLKRRNRVSFKDKVVVITGGSRGLGLAMARELAREGARLHLLARSNDQLQRAAEDLRALGATVDTWPCDIREHGQIESTIHAIGQHSGRIDLLINNAGIILVAPLENLSSTDFDDAMRTHFWGPLHTTRAALPYLRHNQGRIVNIASIGGRLSVPHLAAYSASKFALVGLSDALRNELRAEGIRVTTVCPGLMRTGSHINAEFKGQGEKEFAWFSLGATMPLASISGERAARQILDAARNGQAELTITLQARAAVIAQAIAPNLTGSLMAFASRIMPDAAEGPSRKGRECQSAISPSILTTLGDRASERLNEL